MKDHPSQWIHSGLTCRDVVVQASAYLDDQLPFFTTFRVGMHVASCADCRTYMKQMALVCEVAARLPKPYRSPISRLSLRQHFARSYPPSL